LFLKMAVLARVSRKETEVLTFPEALLSK